jgi:uncharacterized circularly permuted ATP-grasp superfamily protein
MSFKRAIKKIKEQGFVKQQEDETFEEFLHKKYENQEYWDELIEKYQNMSEEEFHEKLIEIGWIKEK